MGLLDFFKTNSDSNRPKSTERNLGNGSQFDDPIGDTLKKATELKKTGDLDSAINELKKLYTLADPNDYHGVSMSSYLRYPMYLDAAGRHDEAWKEFNKLIEIAAARSGVVELSEIYDKMRLVCYRRKKYKDSIMYCALSGLYGLKRTEQYKNDEVKNGMPKSYIKQYEDSLLNNRDQLIIDLNKLLDKANLTEIKSDITDLVNNSTRDIKSMNPGEAVREVVRLIESTSAKS